MLKGLRAPTSNPKRIPSFPRNHAVLAWPQGKGVAVMIGTTGPAGIRNSVQYAEDGIHFTKTHDVVDGPRAGGSYRPHALYLH
ncbi:hypothetical protein CA13_60720 [Planctomycetes bacterium CA13]|uniref:Uncharacterized protein n=1 Tax=Novipirellula herctigrandis TaxID=2527986 RepID=A0A5C5ZBD1_9BACT|nr:hypothetical protein CA13_60720 [Planctomycetes bacterium CA13]